MTDLTEVVAVTLAARDGYANGLSVATRDWYMNSAAAALEATAPLIAAKAWDEGFGVGATHGIAYQSGDDAALPPPSGLNPYRTPKETP